MSLPQTVKQKRQKQPDLICWNCKHQDDTVFPYPCKLFKRFQGEGHCTRFSVGVKK